MCDITVDHISQIKRCKIHLCRAAEVSAASICAESGVRASEIESCVRFLIRIVLARWRSRSARCESAVFRIVSAPATVSRVVIALCVPTAGSCKDNGQNNRCNNKCSYGCGDTIPSPSCRCKNTNMASSFKGQSRFSIGTSLLACVGEWWNSLCENTCKKRRFVL